MIQRFLKLDKLWRYLTISDTFQNIERDMGWSPFPGPHQTRSDSHSMRHLKKGLHLKVRICKAKELHIYTFISVN